MCHELSHLRGYMREDEANFLAYLACRESSFADFRYSGAMLAFVYTNNALISADSELGNEIFRTLCDGAQADFAANSAYWKQFEGPVSEISSTVNDAYLKANRQEDGVRSYGRMVDLLPRRLPSPPRPFPRGSTPRDSAGALAPAPLSRGFAPLDPAPGHSPGPISAPARRLPILAVETEPKCFRRSILHK